jgi:hypothetical protein
MSYSQLNKNPVPIRSSAAEHLNTSSHRSPSLHIPHLGLRALWILAALSFLASIAAWILLANSAFGPETDTYRTFQLLIASLCCVIAVALAIIAASRTSRPAQALLAFAAHMSPTVLLMSVFPWISDDFATMQAGSTPTILVVLAVSVTVPWVSQAASTPFYEMLEEFPRTEPLTFYRGFLGVWPGMIGWSLLPVALFTILWAIVGGWEFTAIAEYAAALVANVIFAQSIIPSTETRRFGVILCSWILYAAALALAPEYWYLSPLAGALPGVILLYRRATKRPVAVAQHPRRALILVGRGFILGSVLWADKFMALLLHRTEVDVFLMYASLIPIVVAQAVYFSAQYPTVQAAVEQIHQVIATRPAREVNQEMRNLSRISERTLASTAFIASFAALAIVLAAPFLHISYSIIFLEFLIAPLVFLCLMLAAFHLTQVNRTRLAVIASSAHLVATVVAFPLLPLEWAYLVLVVVDLIALGWTISRTRKTLTDAPFDLFWKEAAEW